MLTTTTVLCQWKPGDADPETCARRSLSHFGVGMALTTRPLDAAEKGNAAPPARKAMLKLPLQSSWLSGASSMAMLLDAWTGRLGTRPWLLQLDGSTRPPATPSSDRHKCRCLREQP